MTKSNRPSSKNSLNRELRRIKKNDQS